MSVYARSAAYYDALYRAMGKNYEQEAARIHALISENKRSGGNALLDVGCGTGRHMEHLRANYDVEGLDVDRAMLAVAAQRLPNVPLHCQDMIGFNLGKRYDAILCIFGSIGYAPSVTLLNQTIAGFVRHLNPGGVVLLEPWLRPQECIDGTIDARFADEPDLKVARMSVNRRDGVVSILNFHYMVAERDGVRSFTEPHRLMLFTDEQYHHALTAARLRASYDEAGLSGRGLYIGRAPEIV